MVFSIMFCTKSQKCSQNKAYTKYFSKRLFYIFLGCFMKEKKLPWLKILYIQAILQWYTLRGRNWWKYSKIEERNKNNHGDSESMIGLDPFFHESMRFSRGVSTILLDVLINLVREWRAIHDPSDPVHHGHVHVLYWTKDGICCSLRITIQ